MSIDTELYLVRHGETESTEGGIIQGHYDAKLSQRGKEQAVALAERIVYTNPSAIYSSDLSRARVTAEICGQKCNLSVILDRRLREVDMGEWSNRSIEEVSRSFPTEWARSKQGDPDLRRGGGETAYEVQHRMINAINQILEEHPRQCIVVVSHGIAIRTYLAHFLDMTLANAYQRLLLSSASITHIQLRDDGRSGKLACLNDTCHLADLARQIEGF